ncbi:MAG: NAD(P)-binding domain-containing protein [Nitrospirota bacterium]|nr:NAD(P)-binding domain-containing protein [Nitrospirota bacterium]
MCASQEGPLKFLERVIRETELQVQFNKRMEALIPVENGFVVKTSQSQYNSTNVLLALGRRGTPRKLGVPGEEQAKVVYRLIDAEQYRGQHVLVVGGGDSAIEAALALADETGTTVTLSYRSDAFSRLKPKNRERFQEAESQGTLNVMLKSTITMIEQDAVVLDQEGQSFEIQNDAVIICAGGILPTPFLKEIGVMVETHHGGVRAI